MGKIKLNTVFKLQPKSEDEIVSLFNKIKQQSSKKKKEIKGEESSDEDFLNYDFAINEDKNTKSF